MRVGAGQHEGQTGMVVRVEDPVSILLCDAARAELRVFTRDLSESAAAAPGLDTCAQLRAVSGFEVGAVACLGMRKELRVFARDQFQLLAAAPGLGMLACV